MKKSILMLAITGTAMFFMPSCKKAETLLTPTENATLAVGESYTYMLPTNTNDKFAVTTPPAHGKLSILAADSLGKLVYQYIPDSGYVGTDKVVISTVEGNGTPPAEPKDSTMKGSHKPGNCNKDAVRNDYIITLNFNVIPK